MKKYGLLFALSIISLTISGCGVINANDESFEPDESTSNTGGLDEEEALERAISYMNEYNYRMYYSCEISYRTEEGLTSDMENYFRNRTVGPYYYECDKPYVHLIANGIDEYYDATNYEKTVRYYVSNGEWKTSEYDLTKESNQMKYFDQKTHYVNEYNRVSKNYYKMIDGKLEENGFVDLSLTIEVDSKDVVRILIHSIVDDVIDFDGVDVICKYELGAELTDFGQVTVALPKVNG